MTTVVLNTVTRKVEVFSSARDVQARAEIADHKAAADPHPQYLADADAADVALSGDAGDLISGTVPDARMPNWTGYNLASRTALEAANVPAAFVGLRLLGHAVAGDGGGALYKRVGAEPGHEGKIQSADGAWWEIASTVILPQMLGAAGEGTTDDTTALSNAANVAKALGRKLGGFGTYLISQTVDIETESIDLSAAEIKLADNFAADVGINFHPGPNSLDGKSFAIINIHGNQSNQTASKVAIRVLDIPNPHTHVHIHGRYCGTVCQITENMERTTLWVSGSNSELVVHDWRQAGGSSPDNNCIYISGGTCDQFYVQEGSTISAVNLNVQTQRTPATKYPVEVLGARNVQIGGSMRGMAYGAVRIAQGDTQAAGVTFNDLLVTGVSGQPAILVESTRIVQGQISLFGATSGNVEVRFCQGGNLDVAIQDSQGGIGLKLGDTATAVSANNVNVRLAYTNGAAGLVALRTESVSGCELSLHGTALPVEITGTVGNGGLKVTLPATYIKSNVGVTVTSSNTPVIEFFGVVTTAELGAYSTPAIGMRALQLAESLQKPAYYTGTGVFSGWSIGAERGSNGNGQYVKFEDGTMICTQQFTGQGPVDVAAGSNYRSASISWTFPAAFTAHVPAVSGHGGGASALWLSRGATETNASSASFFLMRSGTAAVSSLTAEVSAIGRWF